jgi:hypothetical protein
MERTKLGKLVSRWKVAQEAKRLRYEGSVTFVLDTVSIGLFIEERWLKGASVPGTVPGPGMIPSHATSLCS